MSPDAHEYTTDPSGVSFSHLTPKALRAERTGLRWTRYPADVLPLFVAEMDYTVAPVIQDTIVSRIRASDTGYVDGPGALTPAFTRFARDTWDWVVNPERVFVCTDVSCGVVEPLRLAVPIGGRIAICTPTYPGFFEMFEELDAEIVEIPLSITHNDAELPRTLSARLDLDALEHIFSDPQGIDAFVLCNPHNPHGLVHSREELIALASLAAKYDVFVLSDEIHAPLTQSDTQFIPFAPLAAEAGALSVSATSASKGWNLAGLKCALIIAADARAESLLQKLPPEVAARASILGLHANIAAFDHGRDWLTEALERIRTNRILLAQLIAVQLPNVRTTLPAAGYLAWLDFSDTDLISHLEPDTTVHDHLITHAKVALGKGESFGSGGAHHVRMNLAVPPSTLREAITRIAQHFHTLDSTGAHA